VENDGDLDLLVNNMNDVPLVLLSNLSEKRELNYLKVRLQGKESNRNGLGAMVRVHNPKRRWSQFNDGKSGYLAQSALPLFFGLGDESTITRVEVHWPSGKIQTITNDLIGKQEITVIEQ
jgi:hypothetical protein